MRGYTIAAASTITCRARTRAATQRSHRAPSRGRAAEAADAAPPAVAPTGGAARGAAAGAVRGHAVRPAPAFMALRHWDALIPAGRARPAAGTPARAP